MKNPDNKPLRVVSTRGGAPFRDGYGAMLVQLAIAESNLVKAGKSSGLTHFIAIVKELERVYGFKFEQIPTISAEERITELVAEWFNTPYDVGEYGKEVWEFFGLTADEYRQYCRCEMTPEEVLARYEAKNG
jgi:hypothetical protein